MHFRLVSTAIIFCLTFISSTIAHASSDVGRGFKAAEKFCVRCHVIGQNEFTGIGSTMSFYMMAENFDRYEVRLQTVTERLPHTSLSLDITDENIDDLIVYIKQLDWKARWKRIRPRK